jgi:hypothetical protein
MWGFVPHPTRGLRPLGPVIGGVSICFSNQRLCRWKCREHGYEKYREHGYEKYREHGYEKYRELRYEKYRELRYEKYRELRYEKCREPRDLSTVSHGFFDEK